MGKEKTDNPPAVPADEADVKRTKQRSPNYPVISLKKAMPKAVGLYENYKRNWIPVGIVHQKWQYKPNSGAGNQVISALKSYGLIDLEGSGKDRKVRISERTFQIAQQHKDQPELLKKAALSPALHASLWSMYGQEGLPPDDVLRHFLVFDRNFNPDTVDTFIANFRDTIAFAKLDSSDKIPNEGERESDDEGVGGEDMGDQTNPNERGQDAPKGQRGRTQDDWSGPKVVLDLPRGNQIEIRLRSKVTRDEFEKIKKVYELSELSFIDHEQE